MKILLKILHETTSFKTPFIQGVTSHYTDTRGNKKDWDWVRRVGDQKAVVIAAIYEDKMVITKEYRVPIKDYEWGLPAGLIDKGESVEEAACRELKEETGLDLFKINSVSPPLYSSPGITNESAYVVICTAKGTVSQDLTEDSEDITTFLVSRKELKERFQDKSKKWGAKGFMLMQRFAEFGCLMLSERKDIFTYGLTRIRYRFNATHRLKENFVFSNGIEKETYKKGSPIFIPKGKKGINSNIFFLTPKGRVRVNNNRILHIYSKSFFRPKRYWFEEITNKI